MRTYSFSHNHRSGKWMKVAIFKRYPHQKSNDNGKSPLLMGDTSSNAWLSSVMLVFRGVTTIGGTHFSLNHDYEKKGMPIPLRPCEITRESQSL